MPHFDPYTPSRDNYECRDCGTHTTSETRLTECPDCGGPVENIAKAQE